MKRILMMAITGCFAAVSHAAVVPASVFTDNMVLQRDMKVPVWGTAAPGEKITVKFAGQAVSAVADAAGSWRAELTPLAVSSEGAEMGIEGKDFSVTLTNVLVGEVWLCSGQSNMAISMDWLKLSESEISDATNYPLIRLFQVDPQPSSDRPQTAVRGKWMTYTRDSAAGFSATANYFGRALSRRLGVPIGLIQSAVGGTMIEAWISRPALEQIPFMTERLQESDVLLKKGASESRDAHQQKLDDWRKARVAAKKAGQRDPGKPILFSPKGPHNPSTLYNGMVAPLVPYTIRGVIWYQGESNEGRPEEYNDLLETLIRSWRETWGQGDFPFLIVQLANFKPIQTEPNEGYLASWAYLREAQQQALELPNTAMAVVTDSGGELHPKEKKNVGERLALAALAKAYGENIVYSGPLFQSMEIKGHEAVIHFSHTGSGLMAKEGPLKGFAVSGTDSKWYWADAWIDGDTVVVSSPQVSAPVAVRYNWADNPIGNLYNNEGLPASLFRTDF